MKNDVRLKKNRHVKVMCGITQIACVSLLAFKINDSPNSLQIFPIRYSNLFLFIKRMTVKKCIGLNTDS